jgi:xylose dehydrogenase (NAD/NADP)
VPAIRAAGGEVVAVGSRDLERAQKMAGEMGIPQAHPNYEAVLAAAVDCIYLPLPNSLHLPWTERALAAGKHVLCEKPLALSADEALAMGRAAHRHGRVLAEALMYRYHPRWREALRLLRSGVIGEPQHVAGSFAFPLAPGADYRWRAELGGGALYDVGSYLVSASRQVFGAEPLRVMALARSRGGVDVRCDVQLDFGERGSAALGCAFERGESQWLRVEGEEGSLQVPLPFTAWIGQQVPLYLERSPGLAAERIETPAADPYREMVEHFMRKVRSSEQPLTSAREAAANLAVLDACRSSLESGSAVSVIMPPG